MRHYVQSFVRSILVLFIAVSAAGAGRLQSTGSAVPGEVLIKVQAGASAGAMAGILAEADEGQRLASVGSGAIWRMRSKRKNAEALVMALQKNPQVVYAEPNYIVRLVATPNDPLFTSLWGLKNTGQVIGGATGFGGSDIDAEPAWSVTTGSASIVIGVIDTGVDYNHPDLVANMWSNPGGKGNVACAAGTHGFNAITGTCDPMDNHYHGTHVAGTIGAVGSNGVGVTGVNWTTSIMALKFLDWDGYGTTADAIAAIDFAVQAKIDGVNVRVLSNSWGGGGFSKALLDAINKAQEHNILFVAAAGNDGSSNDVYPQYPANYATANMISVAATDNRDALAYFSNYGASTVHLGAPGVNIRSTFPGSSYGYLSGTSMAAPHVSGVAGLLLAVSPGLTTADVKSAILNNTDPISSLASKTSTGGRLNAAKALGLPASPDFGITLSPSARTVTQGASTTYGVSITPSGGFTGAVTLSVKTLPTGVTGTFSPNPATSTSTLTLTTTPSVPTGSIPLTVSGVSGASTRTTPALLQVVATPTPATGACPAFNTNITYNGATPAAVATGDFNRDGRTDLAVAYVSADQVAVRLGNGNGTFLVATGYGTGSAPIHVAAGDVDGDGKLDLAVANSGSNDISVLIGNGDGTFDEKVDYDAGTSPFAVAVGDFNSDGRSDLAVANNASADVSILIGAGDGTFATAVQYGAASGPFHLVVEDFDRDGNADLAVAGFNSDQVSILLGNGDGTFAVAVDLPAGDGPSSVAAGDINMDGKLDLVVSNYSSGTLSFLIGNGDGSFAAAVHRPTGEGLYSVAIGDFNGDGKHDLIAANGDSNTVVILLGAGGGAFLPADITRTVGYEPNQVTIADFNGDGKSDFVVANGGSSTISVVLNASFCNFSCGNFAPYPNTPVYAVNGSPFSLAGGDFNRDGRIDFAVPTRGTNTVTLLTGNADSTFATGAVTGVGTNPDSAVAGDFNGDGSLDVVTANSGSGNVSVVLGNGDGTFQAAVNYAAGTTPRSVATADFNRDGNADLVVATSASPSVSILLGNGDGTFQAPVAVAAGTAPFHAEPGDFNGDGLIDVAVANSGSANISILLGNGNGTFQAATNYAVGTTPRSIAVHDFDRNGKADLVVANSGSNSNTVSVLLGVGNGTFQAAVSYQTAGYNPFHVAAGDLTGDGIPDLIVSNNGAGGLGTLAGTGAGTFAAAVQNSSGGFPAWSVLADINRDGKLDLAVANPSYGVGIMINRCPAPDLTITKSHSGNFKQASKNHTYTITVENVGLAPTSGLITLQELLPPSLTATDMNAQGWNCSFATSACTRTDALPPGFSQAMTLTVDVAAGAPASVTNVVTIAGGGELNTTNNSASDPTTITPIVDLTPTLTHSGNFTQGATGRKYTSVVRNVGGSPTSGLVSLTSQFPASLTLTGISGAGWSCSLATQTCNRSDVLAGGASYPPITWTVSVAANAPATVSNFVTVTGGGDTYVANNSGFDSTMIWSAQSCGTFGGGQTYNTFDNNPVAIVTGRFDSDASPDVAVANYYSGTVSVLRGKPDGSFFPALQYPAGSYPLKLAVGDLNRDGKRDLLAVNYYSQGVSVLLGNGDGGFAAPVFYGVGADPLDVIVGDFNQDAKSDLAVTNSSSGTVSILIGNGDGTLQAEVTYAVGTYPQALAVSDFDGNGISDLAVTRHGNAVSVLLGNGNGTFAAAVSSPVTNGSTAIAVGDFNQDGKQDLATTTVYNHAKVAILLGNGNGTFQAAVYYDGAYSAGALVSEDINGDSKADLLLSHDGGLSILFGKGNGTFEPPSYRYLGAGSTMTVDDFNADGRPDLAFTSYYNGGVMILLGGCADLTITKTHTGNFSPGPNNNPTYSIKVSNSGTGASLGTVTVKDLLPAGFFATVMYGSGWSCDESSATCETDGSIVPGQSLPTITLLVAVDASAAANVVNTATVSGGGDNNATNNTASDPSTVVQIADLTVKKSHVGVFAQGQLGRTYTITVKNNGGAPTSGNVTVVDSLPYGLVATDLSGQGWTCNLQSCSRSDALAPQSSYPPITMTVNVLNNAPSNVTNFVTVAGGADAITANNSYSDPTSILTTPTNLVATALSGLHVSITWDAPVHATAYQLYRSSGGSFQLLGTFSSNVYSDQSVSANKAYLYRVRPLANEMVGGFSNVDVATTVVFTDDPLEAGVTTVKAAHVNELRAAVAAMRNAAGVTPFAFTDPVLSNAFIRWYHWAELRTAVEEARSALGLVGATYSDPVLDAGTKIKAAHLRELRSAVR
jgi:uncharacterized repeat protein (TIGR01451 family)